MPPDQVTVRVPATSANLGPGFDCLGLALELSGTVTLQRDTSIPEGGAGRLVIEAARRLFQAQGEEAPLLAADYDDAVPLARGLGASAILRVGGLMAANAMLSDPLTTEELLQHASALEHHADNAAPAIFGGMQVAVTMEDGRVAHAGVSLPDGLSAVLYVPDFQMATQKSRRVLPAQLSRSDAVYNVGRAALLVAALAGRRLELLDEATQDRLHQPARSSIFPAMFPIFEAAKAAGALCAYLSGGGSTICALAAGDEERIGRAMSDAAAAREVDGRVVVTRPSERGAEVVEAR
ncbi:MAG TPA: homoserine kinase [Dehalococcoidia bacterium]|nr:homoserine kinase [Dehalococcoidia bacterium]